MKDLYIVGAGGMGRELLNNILDIHRISGQRWNIRGFLDDTPDPLAGKECGYPVVGTIQDYFPGPDDVLAMGVADPAAKKKLASLLKGRGAVFESIIHPHTNCGRHNVFGEGLIVYPGCGMSVNIRIGDFCTLLCCSIGHDDDIGDFCTVSGFCNIMGNVTLGAGAFLGGNVAVAPHVSVGEGAYLCLGSMVMKDVKPGDKVLGNPARAIGRADTALQ